jgi:hypothetical protein
VTGGSKPVTGGQCAVVERNHIVKSNRVRMAVAAVVAGVALSGCGVQQAGTAAYVGNYRISSSELDAQVREFHKALARNGMTERQLGFGLSLPQMVLYRMANAKQFIEYGKRAGVTITQRQVDDTVIARGGDKEMEKILLVNGIPPSMRDDAIRAMLIQQTLVQRLGAGQDEESQNQAYRKLVEQADAAVPVRFNPRYGKWDPERGFVPDDRFGAVPTEGPLG